VKRRDVLRGAVGAAAALVAPAAWGQTRDTAPTPATAPTVTRQVLPNGVTLLVRENGAAGVVAATLHLVGGASDDRREQAGITNFLQRAMLRGTTRRSAAELLDAMADIGGTLETAADVDYAELRGAALARHWERLLDLLAEVARAPALAPEEVERVRRLVISEVHTRADNPSQFALDAMLAELYGAHPYGLPPLGLAEAVERISRDDLAARYRTAYRPSAMVLAVSGRVPGAAVVRRASRLFGDLTTPDVGGGRSVPGTARAGEPRTESVAPRHQIERPGQQAQVLVGAVGPGIADADYAAVKVLSVLLGGGLGGRLFIELREKRGLAYSVGVVNPSRRAGGYLIAHIGTEARNAPAAEAGLLRELERVRGEDVTEGELARAKAYLLGTLAMDRRTNAREAWYLAFFEGAGVGWDFPERYARAAEAVTIDDVRRVAARYLATPRTVVLLPLGHR
jgi:predicted Zn-dependent peptidase